MSESEYSAISEEFLSTIQSLSLDRKYFVAIMLNEPEGLMAKLDEELERLSSGASPEKNVLIDKYGRDRLMPLEEYLGKNEITDVKLLDAIGDAVGEMTGAQILDLATEDYIRAISNEYEL
jgi:hypothetical protein